MTARFITKQPRLGHQGEEKDHDQTSDDQY